ncbi:MAG: hypothetical protein PF508_04355, partial [Spirochaeta sp.]|nr:hypothetical protein [Spirochaeta sp.]
TGSGGNLTKPGFPYPFLPVFSTIIRLFLSDPYVFLRALTSGLDLNNGDLITGRLNVDTRIMTVTDTTSSYQIIQLERIR